MVNILIVGVIDGVFASSVPLLSISEFSIFSNGDQRFWSNQTYFRIGTIQGLVWFNLA